MSDNATLVERLHYAVPDEQWHRELMTEAAARIAELEAERDKFRDQFMGTYEKQEWLGAMRDSLAIHLAEARTRIAELEAEVATLHRDSEYKEREADAHYERLRKKYADTVDRQADLEAERDKLRAELAWYAEASDYDLSMDAGQRAKFALSPTPSGE